MIAMAGILFFLFIGFNHAFNGEGGMVETIWEHANETLTGVHGTQFDENVQVLTQGFGIGCVSCFLLAIVFFLVDAFRSPPRGMQY